MPLGATNLGGLAALFGNTGGLQQPTTGGATSPQPNSQPVGGLQSPTNRQNVSQYRGGQLDAPLNQPGRSFGVPESPVFYDDGSSYTPPSNRMGGGLLPGFGGDTGGNQPPFDYGSLNDQLATSLRNRNMPTSPDMRFTPPWERPGFQPPGGPPLRTQPPGIGGNPIDPGFSRPPPWQLPGSGFNSYGGGSNPYANIIGGGFNPYGGMGSGFNSYGGMDSGYSPFIPRGGLGGFSPFMGGGFSQQTPI